MPRSTSQEQARQAVARQNDELRRRLAGRENQIRRERQAIEAAEARLADLQVNYLSFKM